MLEINKKGVSAIIGYVLLIMISISVAGTVYFWLSGYFGQEEVLECSEDISILISDIECEGNVVNITFRNSGLFSLEGYLIKGGVDTSSLSIDLASFLNEDVGGANSNGVVFFDEDFDSHDEITHQYVFDFPVNVFEVTPVNVDENSNVMKCFALAKRSILGCDAMISDAELLLVGDVEENVVDDTVEVVYDGEMMISFDADMDVDLSEIMILRNDESVESAFILIMNLDLPEGETKTVYFDAVSGSGSVCLKDEDLLSINEISEDCSGEDEVLINCPGDNGGYGCEYDEGRYAVSGLSHSGVLEMAESEYVHHWVSGDRYTTGAGDWKFKFLLSEIASLPNAPQNFDDMKLGYSWVNNVGTADTSDDSLYITVWDSEYVYHWVSDSQSGIGEWKSKSLLKDVITGEHVPKDFGALKLGYSYINTFGTADTSDDKLMISVWDNEYAYRWAADWPFKPGTGAWIEKYSHSEYLTDPNSPTNLDDMKLGYSYVDEMGTSSSADDKTKFVVWDSEYAYRWEFNNVGEGVTWETRIPLSEILETDSSSPSESSNFELGYGWMNSFGTSDVSDDRRYITVWTNGYLAKAEKENYLPTGHLDQVGETGLVWGWSYDKNLGADPVSVHFYLDGEFLDYTVADKYRPDVEEVFPGYGEYHGYNYQLSGLSVGAHEISVYAINEPMGEVENPLLGSKSFYVDENGSYGEGSQTCLEVRGKAMPFYKLYHSGNEDHFYTTSANEKNSAVGNFGFSYEKIEGYVSSENIESTVPLYRLYHSENKDHFYTTSASEKNSAVDNLGFSYEKIEGYISSENTECTIPLYQLYHSKNEDHFYTTSVNQKDFAVNLEFLYEGIVGYMYDGIGVEAEFTVAVLPDTQYYAATYPEIFANQTQWIVDNKDKLNIQFVVHLGDLVHIGSDKGQWEVARESMNILDGKVPYLVAPGNHDYDNEKDDVYLNFNEYFPYTKFEGESWYKGHYPSDGNQNNYGTFSVDDQEYLVLGLDRTAGDEYLEWADEIISQNFDKKIVMFTHAYMYDDDTRTNSNMTCGEDSCVTSTGCATCWTQACYDTDTCNDGEEIWKKLVSKHSNIVLVLSGHILGDGLGRRTDMVEGKEVHQILQNYQFLEDGGSGWLRYYTFIPNENKISAMTYSPYLQKYNTSADNQFELSYS